VDEEDQQEHLRKTTVQAGRNHSANGEDDNVMMVTWLKYTAFVIFAVFTAVTMKNAVFWDVTPCGSFKNGRYRAT
jgi:hypothetical protein